MEQIILDRRALHRIPELDKDTPKTLAYLQNSLSGLKCKVFSPCQSALCAYFDFGADSAVAFRSDTDALPLMEDNDTDYVSTHPGKMHACGHDGHMAILLELARRLDKLQSCKNNVLLVFQPAEESGGGAKDICETGVFTEYNARAIFGLHVWAGMEKGSLWSCPGPMMIRSSSMKIDVYGQSVHVSEAYLGKDAMAAGMEIHRRIMALDHRLPPETKRLIKIGKFHSGTVGNAVAEYTEIRGTLRAYEDDLYFSLREQIYAICKHVEEETGCTVKVDIGEGYPAVWNPEDLYEQVCKLAPIRYMPKPSMGAEDFSWYQRYLPGLFIFMGVGAAPAAHSTDFDFDDSVLVHGADYFQTLAEQF